MGGNKFNFGKGDQSAYPSINIAPGKRPLSMGRLVPKLEKVIDMQWDPLEFLGTVRADYEIYKQDPKATFESWDEYMKKRVPEAGVKVLSWRSYLEKVVKVVLETRLKIAKADKEQGVLGMWGANVEDRIGMEMISIIANRSLALVDQEIRKLPLDR